MTRWMLLPLAVACGGGEAATTPGTDGADPTDDSGTPTEDTDTSDTETETDTDTTPTDSGSDTTETGTTSTTPVTDFRLEGPAVVTESVESLAVDGCTLGYTLFLPDGDADAPLLVLGHGFQRAPRNMAGLARHVASHGMRVAAPEFCWDRLTGSDHPRNGTDAAALAEHLAPGEPVVYSGYSAGGLATLYAVAEDPDAIGYLGLDPVDTDGAVAAALAEPLPRWALMGEPSACNANSSIRPFLEDAGVRISVFPGATHCDFELPTDGFCTALCGGTSAGTADIVKTVLAAFASDRHGLDATAREWVDGASWQGLLNSGAALELSPASPPW